MHRGASIPSIIDLDYDTPNVRVFQRNLSHPATDRIGLACVCQLHRQQHEPHVESSSRPIQPSSWDWDRARSTACNTPPVPQPQTRMNVDGCGWLIRHRGRETSTATSLEWTVAARRITTACCFLFSGKPRVASPSAGTTRGRIASAIRGSRTSTAASAALAGTIPTTGGSTVATARSPARIAGMYSICRPSHERRSFPSRRSVQSRLAGSSRRIFKILSGDYFSSRNESGSRAHRLEFGRGSACDRAARHAGPGQSLWGQDSTATI